MSALVVDTMNNAAQWTPLQADAVTPSTDLVVASDNTVFARGADGVCMRIEGSTAAEGHLIRRSLGPIDISGFRELRLSLRSGRVAGEASAPFFLELRLASAALPFGNAGNTWNRLLPVASSGVWTTVKLSLDDLPGGIATALTQIQVRCISGNPPFIAHIDDLIAVLPELIVDANQALQARLSGIVIGGTAVGATVRSPGEPPPAAPALDIVNTDVQYAPPRVRDADALRDYTDDGHLSLVPLGDPYDIYYSVTPLSTTADENAGMVEAVLQRIGPSDELDVNGDSYMVETLWLPREERPAGGDESPVLYYKVGARTATAARRPVRRVDVLTLATDQR